MLEFLLKNGFRVTTLVQEPEILTRCKDHSNHEILRGEIVHYPDVYNAVQGNDIIISVYDTPPALDFYTKGTVNIVRAMRQSTIKKFICLSPFCTDLDKKLLTLPQRVVAWLRTSRAVLRTIVKQEEILCQNNINFILVKHSGFYKTHSYSSCHAVPITEFRTIRENSGKVSRKGLVEFLVTLINDEKWNRRTIYAVGSSKRLTC
ncbi:MAG: NAD(P)H-binding protein [Cyclobacteriaceae bacterium]|nr:NAD(P)H-binding protein [Cyclobacteriaceae bacterium]